MDTLQNAVTFIVNGASLSSVIDSMLGEAKKKKKGGKSDLWRQILTTLYEKVRTARRNGLNTTKYEVWLPILSNTASAWGKTNQDIVAFLRAFNILNKLKQGQLDTDDILKVYTRMVGTEDPKYADSEEEFDAYRLARKKEEPSTERLRMSRKEVSKKLKHKKKKKKRPNDK